MTEGNGRFNGGVYDRLGIIESDVKDIKDDLATAVNLLTTAVSTQTKAIETHTTAVTNLSYKFDTFINVAQNSLPVKAVFWLLGIIVLALVGVEGVKQIGPVIKSIWLLP